MKTRSLPSGRTIAVRDNHGLYKRCSCARRRWSTCPHSWIVSFKWQARLHRITLDRLLGRHLSKADAQHQADLLRARIRDGQSPTTTAPDTPEALTFAEFGEVWRTRARASVSPGQQNNDKSILGKLGALPVGDDDRLGDRPLGRITLDDLETAFAHLSHLNGSTWNKYRQTVASLERWGLKKGYLVVRRWVTDDSDIQRKPGGKRESRLVPDERDDHGRVTVAGEERRLFEAASPWLQRLVVGLLETCCRKGELLSLQWRHVDLAGGQLTILAEHAKSRKLRRLPIIPRLAGVLNMIKHDPAGQVYGPDAYVFGNAVGERIADPKRQWRTTCDTAGIDDLRLHDLRHEAASRLLEAGWPASHVQHMLGHADLRTTSIYVNVTASDLVDSMTRYGTQSFHNVSHEAPIERQPLGNDDPPLAAMGVFPLLKSLLPVVVAFLLPTTDTLDHRRVGNGTHRHGLFQEPMEELPAMA